ncbi:terpenoid cyclases/Protein prenyltransferase [Laetiporus sulphureus 93-53]|uniref:Protein farnesyltransferase subunit beta n=1 Tax=Laetiporus sulphureus 93-53 TaxID=1314785 RepID=A0A165DVF7_9APHY|nr:terpenoid cyclases/Protein prenyltransferase [Laetiporus sulphureus 93-53]KZT05705.1 terpenoid cyclases/Protein prenyltransferase [Laetiporus sulphureus 93-53]
MFTSQDRRFRSTPIDGYPTQTSDLQASTEDIFIQQLPLSAFEGGARASAQGPTLHRDLHLQLLLRNLLQGFPQRYTSQDASQPWLLFWTLQGFSVLGVALDDKTKKRARETLLALQHPDGGFSGGPGQAAHLLPTYAAVCALANVGQPGTGGAWDDIDRKKMYEFFMSLKQEDGSFLVTRDGEVDVRGLYCLLSVATLLNLMTPELLAGIPEFLVTCQTYEGGFGNASFPEWAFEGGDNGVKYDPSAPRPVLGEAHGGYTFCALASWVLIQPYIHLYYPTPSGSPPPSINLRALLRWLTHMQGIPIELGGFKGRTNKLVDGCYSWWVGGCFALVEALFGPSPSATSASSASQEKKDANTAAGEDEAWDDVDDALMNREALQEYILYAGQHSAGGLRDKPPKPADSYHTLYCLAGLSAAQHRVTPVASRKKVLLQNWKADEAKSRDGTAVQLASADELARLDELRKECFASALDWLEDEGADIYIGGNANRLNATHPLFNLTVTHAELMMTHFYGQSVPPHRAR